MTLSDRVVDPLFDASAFSLAVRLAMARANISYRDLAEVIGVDQANIHRVAKRALSPSIETYLRLKKWLDEMEDKA